MPVSFAYVPMAAPEHERHPVYYLKEGIIFLVCLCHCNSCFDWLSRSYPRLGTNCSRCHAICWYSTLPSLRESFHSPTMKVLRMRRASLMSTLFNFPKTWLPSNFSIFWLSFILCEHCLSHIAWITNFGRTTAYETFMTSWSYEQWMSILKLASLWDMKEIRNRAIKRLSATIFPSPIAQIQAGRNYSYPPWVRVGFLTLVTRDASPLSESEGTELGMRDALRCAATREKIITYVQSTVYFGFPFAESALQGEASAASWLLRPSGICSWDQL